MRVLQRDLIAKATGVANTAMARRRDRRGE